MHTVREVAQLSRPAVLTIQPDQSVLDAASLMNSEHIGALVVTDPGGKVIGIISERDVLTRVVAAKRDPQATSVKEVMTAPVTCADPDTTRAEVHSLMRLKRIRHLPVIENDRVVAMVSVRDILEDEREEREETLRHLYEYLHGGWPTATPS